MRCGRKLTRLCKKKIYYDENFEPELIVQNQDYPKETNRCKEYGIYVQKLTVKNFSTKCERPTVFLPLQVFLLMMAGKMHKLATIFLKTQK